MRPNSLYSSVWPAIQSKPCCREEGEESRLTIMALRVELQSAQTGQDLLQSQLQAAHRELECEREALQQQRQQVRSAAAGCCATPACACQDLLQCQLQAVQSAKHSASMRPCNSSGQRCTLQLQTVVTELH